MTRSRRSGRGGTLQAAQQGKGQVGIQMTLVKLVQNDAADAAQGRIAQQAPEQNAFGDEAQAGVGAVAALEADLVADRFAHSLAKLVGDAAGGHTGGDAAGLEHDDFAGDVGEQGRRDAGGLASTGRGLQDQAPAVAQGAEKLGQDGVDGEAGQGFGLHRQAGNLHPIRWCQNRRVFDSGKVCAGELMPVTGGVF